MAGRLCEELVQAVLPPSDPGRCRHPPVALAVLDDYHMLGSRIVYSVLDAVSEAVFRWGRYPLDWVPDGR